MNGTRRDDGSRPDDHFDFSSIGRDPAESFADYVRLYAHGSDVSRGEGHFQAEVHAWRLENMLLFDRRLSGVIHSRAARVARDGFDHILLYAIIAGELIGSPEARFEVGRPGDIILLDTTRAMRTEARECHYLTVSIARHLIEPLIGDVANIHGCLVRPPRTLVLMDYLLSLGRRAADIVPASMPTLSQVLIDLLGATLAPAPRRAAENHRQNILRRQVVENFIADNIGDRTLSSATISRATGVSRSSLYRLLSAQGGVNRLIQTYRLDALRVALEDGSDMNLAQLGQRYGFSSESHMSRLFAESYGQPPGAYRQSVRMLAEGDAGTGHRRWRGWMSELG